ncbi:MAG: hypothetical protein J6E43_00905 [Prevotella sp.]|nr:hypothetical protein [Prevotella sp.]
MNLNFLDNLESRTFGETIREDAVTTKVTFFSLIIGGAFMIICNILSLFISNQQSLDTTYQVILYGSIAIAVAVYLVNVFSVLTSNIQLGTKIGYSLFVLFFGALGYVGGMFIGFLLIYVVVLLIMLWLIAKVFFPLMMETIFGKSSTSSTRSRSSGFRECSNCQHNTSRDSLNGFCELRGGNVSAGDSCGNWDPC